MPLIDVPLATQTLAVTQPLIRGNFTTINTAFNVNHVDFSLSDAGKHKWVTFPFQSSAPSGTFLMGEYGLYNASSATGHNLFAHIQTNAGPKEIPFTESTLQLTTPTSGQGGWTKLPSGMILIMGSGNGNGYTTITITNPAISQILMVVVSPFNNSNTDANRSVALAGIGTAALPVGLGVNQFAVYCATRNSSGAAASGFSYWVLAYL